MPSKDIVFTIPEAAAYLRVHASSIRRHIKEKNIPAFRVGSAWRLRKESIDTWARKQEQRALKKRRPKSRKRRQGT